MSLNDIPTAAGSGANNGYNAMDMKINPEILLNHLKAVCIHNGGNGLETESPFTKIQNEQSRQVNNVNGSQQQLDLSDFGLFNSKSNIFSQNSEEGEQKSFLPTSRSQKHHRGKSNGNNGQAKHSHSRSLSGNSQILGQSNSIGSGANAEKVKRTIYVADLHHQVSEQELAEFFRTCGPIVDYRICGDTNTVLRFAFIEFLTVSSAKEALKLSGSVLGECAVRVSPSKTAIIPVKDQFLPRSEREREAVARTIYVANIHQTVERDVLRQFFEMVCGHVSKIRLLGDAQHDTKIAFVEFASKDSTAAALRCTGAMLGPLAIRVSPSKTPVRTDARRRVAEPNHLPSEAVSAAAKLSRQMRNEGNTTDGRGRGGHGKDSQRKDEVPASPTILSLLEGILSD